MHDPRFRKFRLLIPLAIAGFLALFSFAVYALWNGIVTDVFGLKTITYWQALGLLVLCKILFGGFPGRGRGFGPSWKEKMMWAERCGSFSPEERERFREEMRQRFGAKRWESWTPEERERFRAEMRQRFGKWPRPDGCEPGDTGATPPDKTP